MSVHSRAVSSDLSVGPQLHTHSAHFEHRRSESLEEDGFVVGILRDIAPRFHVDEQRGVGGENALVLQHCRVVVLVELVGGEGLRGDACRAVHRLRAHGAQLVGVGI